MKNKITIIGTGALGTSLAKILYNSNQKNIVLYGNNNNELEELKKGKNTKYFPKTTFIPKFKTTPNIKEAIYNAKYIVLAVPSQVSDIVFKQIIENIDSEVLIINGSKGFYPNSELPLHAGLENDSKDIKKIRGIVSLLGPSHAEEMINEVPTSVCVVSRDEEMAREIQKLFSNHYFKCYVQTDVIGAEVGAAYKNVLAIASGISAGLGFGVNTMAALLTRGIAEMQKFNKLMKGKQNTIYGLTGIGDLIVTATSNLSRNYTFGKELVEKNIKYSDTKSTVEGYVALNYIKKISDKANLELPIVNQLHKIFNENMEPKKAFNLLWERELKSE